MKQILSVTSFLAVLLFSCTEKELQPLVKNNNKPGVVTNIKVENKPGGATISYTLPDDPDVLYVQAVFTTQQEERIVKSSIYKNFVELEGFADTDEHEVKLYAVNRSENKSDMAVTKIKPGTPPIFDVFATLKAQATFGGIKLNFENVLEREYVLHTLYQKDGEWVAYDRLYSNAKQKEYAVRGLPSEPLRFAFFFTDVWKNHSDTLLGEFTPLLEKELDKELWKHKALLTDTYQPQFSAWEISNLWKGGTGSIFYVDPNLPGLKLPNWFTIDLGQKAIFSRIKVNQLSHHNSFMYSEGAPLEFEIYGSNDPDADGGWNNWTLLTKLKSVKPSGQPIGSLSAEDIAVAKAGEEFEFPITGAYYRYIRFKTLKTYGGSPNVMLSELTMWGQPEN